MHVHRESGSPTQTSRQRRREIWEARFLICGTSRLDSAMLPPIPISLLASLFQLDAEEVLILPLQSLHPSCPRELDAEAKTYSCDPAVGYSG